MAKTEWFDFDGISNIPDMLRNSNYLECGDVCERGWDVECTRVENHTGRHSAGNGAVIIAVWN